MCNDKIDHIMSLANECKLHSENACNTKHEKITSIAFIQQAFYCAKELEKIYYSDCKIAELMNFYKHFYFINEALLLETGLVEQDLKTLDELYYTLKQAIVYKQG